MVSLQKSKFGGVKNGNMMIYSHQKNEIKKKQAPSSATTTAFFFNASWNNGE